jgi:hypothetical protein
VVIPLDILGVGNMEAANARRTSFQVIDPRTVWVGPVTITRLLSRV